MHQTPEVIGQPRERRCVLGRGVVRAGQVVVGAVAHTNERTGPHTITRGNGQSCHYLSTPPSGGRCITPALCICYLRTGQGRRTKSKAFGCRLGPEGSTTRRRGQAVADADSGWPDLVFLSVLHCPDPGPFWPASRSTDPTRGWRHFALQGYIQTRPPADKFEAPPFAPHAVIGCLVVSYQTLTALWMSPSPRRTSETLPCPGPAKALTSGLVEKQAGGRTEAIGWVHDALDSLSIHPSALTAPAGCDCGSTD